MVATGDPYENGQNTEIIGLCKSQHQYALLSNTPERYGSVGGFLENQYALICGGKMGYYGVNNEYFQDVLMIGESNSANRIQMIEKRAHAACLVLDQKNLWVVGGSNCYFPYGLNDHKTSEFISITQPSIMAWYSGVEVLWTHNALKVI